MRSFGFTVLAVLAAAGACPPASGQAVTEYGIGAGRAATTTAPARNAASAIAGALENLSKAAGADTPAASSKSTSPGSESRRPTARARRPRAQSRPAKSIDPPAATPPPAAPPVYEDPRQIQTGIDYDEMVRRFGPPSMLVTTAPGVTTLWYSSGDSTYQVEMRDGKVASAPAGAGKPAQ